MKIDRVTFDPNVMGGQACIRGMRVTAGMIVGMLASGTSRERILEAYPYLEPEDIDAAHMFGAKNSTHLVGGEATAVFD